ncbi:MAG: ribonuclease E/G, partial [Pseudomonadota bacterium]
MASKMLIDAGHPEETRVVVIQGNRIEEFDYESSAKRQLRGNIYLAKVTRVEPSLQAAFVDYGGNRHGFLAFSEIHPDYYQIPVADRQALAEAMSEERDDEDGPADEGDSGRQTGNRRGSRRGRRGGRRRGSRAPVQAGDDGEESPAPIDADPIEADPIEADRIKADSVAADAAIGEASVSDFDTPADGTQNDFADLDAPDMSTADDPLLAPSYGGEESQAETDIDASAGAAAAVSSEASDAERDGESAPDLAADGDPVIAPKALAQAPEPTLTSPEIEPIDPEPEVPETQDLHAHADEEAPEPEAEAEEDVLEHGTEIVSATGEDEGIWDSAVEQSQAFLARQDDEAADESGADEEDEDEEDDEAGEGRRYRRRSRQRASYRRYKIQEVIKKRQIMLVQVVKEER